MDKPKTSELAKLADISKSYASEILSGKRAPARALAIHIMRKTGWRHERIADLTDADIAALERIEPYQPQSAAA